MNTLPAPYNFTQVVHAANFTIKIDPAERYGYFEHDIRGDNCAGGLWFDGDPAAPNGMTLMDADGTTHLPREVAQALRQIGYTVDDSFD